MTSRALRRGLEHPEAQSERIAEVQTQARERLLAIGVPEQALDAAWRNLGDEYFLRYSVDEILWHNQSILNCTDADLPLVLIRPQTQRGGTEIFIYMREHIGLFAQTTAILDQLGLNVADARIITSTDGYTLDTFIVLEEDGTPIEDSYRMQELLNTLKERLGHPAAPPGEVRRRLPRQLRHFTFPTEVQFSEDRRNQRTIMEVTAFDRPGLLSRIGAALMACEVGVQTAKIATFGERAEDIFFITDAAGQPLHDPAQLACLRDTVIRNLDDAQI